ncbi:hypothetical protein GGF37_006620, partial [Kickxella alabastrina]
KPRTLVNRLTSQIEHLVSMTSNLMGSGNTPLPVQSQPLPSAIKIKSARALMAHEITQSVIAPPMYVQALSAGKSMPSLQSDARDQKSIFGGSLKRMRSRHRNSIQDDHLRIRCIGALEHSDSRIMLPNELAADSAEHVLGLLSTLLKLHEIVHTFVETRRMPVRHAFDSSTFSLKTMAAMMASAYPPQQQLQQNQQQQQQQPLTPKLQAPKRLQQWKRHNVDVNNASGDLDTSGGAHNAPDALHPSSEMADGLQVYESSTRRPFGNGGNGSGGGGGGGQFKSLLYSIFSKSEYQSALPINNWSNNDNKNKNSNAVILPRPHRRLTQLSSQLREKVHRRSTAKQAPQPALSAAGAHKRSTLAASIVHPPHIQQQQQSAAPQPVEETALPPKLFSDMEAPEVITTIPVKHATAIIFAQYSPSLNRWRETEVVEYYSCSVRIELVRVISSNLRQQRYRYALLVERMTGHKG